ncbi:4-hydroxy-tetrahydrodipicolinate synthase, partial [bacterium]|nr:4-hydroxy-tetrahydrodipicolinate synthase [bacterium]
MIDVCTALITPFLENGEIDIDAFEKLLQLQEDAGIGALVIGGTTGEGWSLSLEEVEGLVEMTRRHFSGKIIIGTGDISTEGAVAKTAHAKKIGADAALVIVPYYTFPSEAGTLLHFQKIASLGLPVIVYHHPKRTGLKLSLSCLKSICEVEGIVGVKETSGDLLYVEELSKVTRVYSGDDLTMNIAKEKGACGVISVVANLLPKETKAFFASNKREFAEREAEFIAELCKECNPSGIKEALREKKYCENFVRLPLVTLSKP